MTELHCGYYMIDLIPSSSLLKGWPFLQCDLKKAFELRHMWLSIELLARNPRFMSSI